jgi:hypothetical protein
MADEKLTAPHDAAPAPEANGAAPPAAPDGGWEMRPLTPEEWADLERWFYAPPPPIIVQDVEALRRDLPELLKTYSGQWVAYHGGRRLGFHPTSKTALYRQFEHEVPWDELYVIGLDRALLDDPTFQTSGPRD